MGFFNQLDTQRIDKDKFFKLFHFLLQENYLNDGSNIYRKIQVVPTGGRSSSILADIYLYMY